MNRIILTKTVGGMQSRLHRSEGPPVIGAGSNSVEAIGSLVMQVPEEFGLWAITYSNDVPTKQYLLERDLASTIYKKE